MQFPATLVQLAENPPCPLQQPKREKILRLDLSISCNFQQLWLSWQKSAPPWPKREKILRLDLSISCNFQQLWFSWQKSPLLPAATKERKKFKTGSIHFMLFSATLVQLAEKLPLFSAFSSETQLKSHMWNTHGPHTTNPYLDSSYLNIFFRLPIFSTLQNTHIYRRTEHRIMVQVEGLKVALPQYTLISLLLL